MKMCNADRKKNYYILESNTYCTLTNESHLKEVIRASYRRQDKIPIR